MREVDTIFTSIPGGPELVAWFGQVPSFHDAEIVSLNLHRRAPSALIIHAWRMTREVDVRCRYILDRHAVVTFVLEDILDLQLGSFSHQNVIGELRLRRTPEHQDRGAFDWLEHDVFIRKHTLSF
jgi:hypothetical protein